MMIEDFGARVVSVWEGLRQTTRSLIVGALQAPQAVAAEAKRAVVPYDARAEWELSRLLSALEERARDAGAALNPEQARALRRMADTCAVVLQNQAQSAEVFAQLITRALSLHDYARIDELADALAVRFAPSEVCELARHTNAVVRSLAQEALAQAPTALLVELLADPVDLDVAREALERQAAEYGSEAARRIVNALYQADMAEDDV